MEDSILLDVSIDAQDALKELISLKEQIANLKEQQSQCNRKTAEGRAEYTALGEQIKALNKQSQERSKQLQNEVKNARLQENSLNALRAQYSKLNAEWGNMEIGSEEWENARQELAKLDAQILEAEKSVGNFHRQVGNYAMEGVNLSQQLHDNTQKLIEMRLAGKEATDQYKELLEQTALLKDAIADTKEKIKNMANDTGNIHGLVQSFNALTATATVLSQGLQALGVENDVIQNLANSTQKLMAIMKAFEVIQSALQKQSAAMVLLTKARAAATSAYATVKALLTGQITLATIAQKAFNKAVSANPIGALIALAMAAATAIAALISKLSSSKDNTAELRAETERLTEAYNTQTDTLRRKHQIDRANGKSDVEIAQEEVDELRKIYLAAEAHREKISAQIKSTSSKRERANLQKEWDEARKLELDLNKQFLDAKANLQVAQINAEKELQKQAETDRLDQEKQALENEKKAIEAAYDARLRASDAFNKINDEKAKRQQQALSKDFNEQQKWEQKDFARRQQHERKKLDLQLQYSKITQQEYNAQLQLLDQQRLTFQQKQQLDYQKHTEDLLKQMHSLVSQTEQEQIDAIVKQYNTLQTELNDLLLSGNLTDEQADEYLNSIQRLEDERKAKIQKIREDSAKQLLDNTLKDLSKSHELELAQFTNNEQEKAHIQLQITQERVNALQQALEKENLTEEQSFELRKALLTEQASLEQQLQSARANQLAQELAAENLTLRQKYELRKQFLQQEIELAEGNAERQAELLQELAEHDRQYNDQRVANISEWANKAMDIMSSASGLAQALEERQLSEYEDANEKKKTALQKRLDSGIISQEQYDAQVAALDSEMDKKKAELAVKQAKREKALNIMNAIVNTATAIMKIWAEVPKADFGASTIALTAIAAAMGAMQIATIAAQPLPKAARGGLVGMLQSSKVSEFQSPSVSRLAGSGTLELWNTGTAKHSRGGLLRGKSHAQGGIPIEAEGGEAIINKRSTAAFRPILSAINEWGGGVRFANGGIVGNTGNAAKMVIQTQQQQESFAESIANLKIYTAITDIHRADNNYSQVLNIRY